MAIPDWVWTAATTGGGNEQRLDATSEVFEALSNPLRLEILAALAERDEPVAYTDLRADTSVEDNGRFNYHLRQLDDLVVRREAGYALTERGAVAADLLDGEL